MSSLDSSEYTATLEVIEESIIATDLALHFAHLSKLKDLADKGPNGKKSTSKSPSDADHASSVKEKRSFGEVGY